MLKYSKIMFAGPSGFGKTTMAKWIEEVKGIPFISGSVSDLLPQTKEVTHSDMLKRDSNELYKEDYQVLNLRNKLFSKQEVFVTDRSYVDSAAYFIYKQASKIPACEIEQFVGYCSMMIAQQCDCLIFFNFTPDLVNSWVTEDNNKRITNNYFQIEISSIMRTALDLMGYKCTRTHSTISLPRKGLLNKLVPKVVDLCYGIEIGSIDNIYGHTDVYIVNEPNLDIRKALISKKVL